ncbi:MAG: PD-(D/E)XK nuclease family protein, partial [Lachnospiraceae bacterium]|nr:PD-(D/E)XK nuclease family protein [Lachnospiraceae bacterium]
MYEVPACEVNPDYDGERTVIVQGMIDVYFEEDGEFVLADYKTDKCRDARTLTERYSFQLDTYADALTRITGKRVKEKIIYSFALGGQILL